MAAVRAEELDAILKRAFAFAGSSTVMFSSSTLTAALAFAAHTLVFHRELDAATAFGALALFSALRGPLDMCVRVTKA